MTEKDFLRRIKLTAPDMAALLQTADTNRLAEALLAGTDERGRFSAKKVLALLQPQLDRFCEPPAEGWLQHAYNHVLGRLFPEKASGIPETQPVCFCCNSSKVCIVSSARRFRSTRRWTLRY